MSVKKLDEFKFFTTIADFNSCRGHSLVVKPQSSKLVMSVRFCLPAPFYFFSTLIEDIYREQSITHAWPSQRQS